MRRLNQCRAAIAIDPSFAEAFLNLGLAYRKSNRFDDAIKAFEEAIELDGKYAAAFRELGRTFLAKGDVIAARQAAPGRKLRALPVRMRQSACS